MYWKPEEFWRPGEHAASGNDTERRLLIADRLCPGSSALMEALCVLTGEQPLATVARVAAVPASDRIFSLLLGLGLVVSVGGPQRPVRIALTREGDRHVVRARLSPTRWQALHRAAAEVLDPRPALIHRALAAGGPDPELAAALEQAAVDGRAPDDELGVPTRQLLVWAADLSTEREEREHRLLLAAMHDVYAEELADGDLWARVEALPPSPLRYCALAGRALLEQRLGAAVDHLRAANRTLDAVGTNTDAHLDADGAPATRSGSERALSAAAAVATVEAAVACRTARGQAAVEAATRALEVPGRDVVQTRMAQRLLRLGRSYTEGPGRVRSSSDSGASVTAANPPTADGCAPGPGFRDSGLLLLRGECRLLAGDLQAGARDLDDVVGRHDADPGHPRRQRALERLVLAHFLLGNWPEAESAVDRIDQTGGDTAGRALRAMLAAVRGTGLSPKRTVRPPAITTAGPADPDRLTIAACADALALLAHRRHADVLAALAWPTAGLNDAPAKFAPLWLPVHAEAAIEAGTAAAESGLAELRACAERVPYLMVTFHRLTGRAAELRHDPAAASDAYRRGLLAAEGCAELPPLHRAQLNHAYGRFLCALGQMAAGVEQLQQAQDAFVSLGALASARSCVQDRASVPSRPSPRPDVALTEREATVAGLVASGLTNRQVAERLRISAKAVEYHLGKVYRKLGVRTRRELLVPLTPSGEVSGSPVATRSDCR